MNSSKFSTCSSNLYEKWVEGEEGEMRGWIQTFDMVLYEVLLKSWVGEEIEGEDELARELEKENKRAIPTLKILHLRWLKKN